MATIRNTAVDQTETPNAKMRIVFGMSDLSTLGIWVCARRSIAPRRARVQRLFGLQSCIGHF
jgi:hypothetical protein